MDQLECPCSFEVALKIGATAIFLPVSISGGFWTFLTSNFLTRIRLLVLGLGGGVADLGRAAVLFLLEDFSRFSIFAGVGHGMSLVSIQL